MMSLPCITVPSMKVPHFDGTNFVSWKSQMSFYLHEMNPRVWWMVDVGLFSCLGGLPSNTSVKEMSISRSTCI
jgi:hypothetical protein